MPSVDHFLHLVAYEDKRHRMCNIKALNLLPSVLASAFALSEGADEAVFHRGDTVTECAHSNLHIIKDGTLFTHPLGELILPGIERAHLVTVCKRLGIDVKEVPFTLQELRCCDEVLVSSTTRICNLAHSFQDVIYQLKGDSMGAAIIAEMHRDFKSFCVN
jgi:D-alanine transaminase